MAFTYPRTIRFHETDAAGVLYFANGLVLCHEAYEASLEAVGVDLTAFFTPSSLACPSLAYPIRHAAIDFRRPMHCGDRILITLTPHLQDEASFKITYVLHLAHTPDTLIAQAQTRHVCIETQQRSRTPLPPTMLRWLHELSNPPE